jgi:tetratricopeptide (TPR) repeat protein
MTFKCKTLILRGPRVFAAGAAIVLFAGSLACNTSPQAKEAKFLRRGAALMAQKEYTRAYIEFKNASAAMPKDSEPFYQVGVLCLAQGNLGCAADALRKAADLNPKDKRAQLKLGELLAMGGTKELLEMATDRLERVLPNSSASDYSDASDALALAEWKLGKTDEAVGRLEDTLRKFPSRLHSAVELARLKLAQKDLAGAEKVLKQALADAPQSSLAELALGQLYLVTNQPNKAEPELQKSVQLDPKNGLALMGLATIQTAGKRMSEAEETYRKMSALPGAEYKPLHALFLYRQGKRDAALAEFEKLAKEDPKDRAARSRLFDAYVAMGKSDPAQKLVAAALKTNPKDTEALYERAGLSLRSGNVAGAEADLTQVLRVQPDLAEAHAALAAVDRAKGQLLAERKELSEAVRLNPALVQSRVALARNFTEAQESKSALDLLNNTPPNQKGMFAVIAERNWALLGAGDTQEMRSVLDQALKVRRVPELVLQDGVLRLRQGDYAGAIADAEESIKDNDVRGARLLASVYQAQKQPAKAEQRLKELMATYPKSAPIANLLGQWYMNAGNRNEARKAFDAAVAADPKFVDAILSLAAIDFQERNAEGARQRLAGVVAGNPNNVPALIMLGTVTGELGDQEEAVRCYRSVLALDSSNVVALNNIAYSLASFQTDEALKYAERAAELAPDSAMVDDTLGWVYYKKAIYGKAVTYLKMAVAKDPTPRHQFHLAVSYLKAGDREVGQKTLQLALHQDPNLAVTEKGW